MGEHFPHDSISRMVAWDFWAKPSSLAVDPVDEPFVDAPPETVPAGSRERIQRATYKAACDLRDADVGVPCGKPS